MIERLLLWLVLLAFLSYAAYQSSRSPLYIFTPTTVIAMLSAGIFVLSYAQFDSQIIEIFLNHEYYIYTLTYACLCLFLLFLGFHFGARNNQSGALVDYTERLPLWFISSYVALLVGLGFLGVYFLASASGGLIAVYTGAHGSGAAYASVSAYFYSLQTLLWPALLIGYISWLRTGRRSKILLILVVIAALALAAHTFLNGNRNGVIRFSVLLGTTYVFVHRPNAMRMLPLVAVLGVGVLVVLMLPHIRHSTHLGSNVSVLDAISDYWNGSHQPTYVDRTSTGHELFFNVAIIEAVSKTGQHDWGAAYLYPIVNFVPRAVWPDKPSWYTFGTNPFEVVQASSSWRVRNGAAINQVGLSFFSFGWLGSLLWGVFGWVSGRLFARARDNPTLLPLGFYASILLASVYWGTQSFMAVFFGWFYVALPFVGLAIFCRLLVKPNQGMQHRFVEQKL